MSRLTLTHDADLIEEIAAAFDLREHNRRALNAVVTALAGDYDPAVQQVMNMATGSGKTYLMAALIEYLRRQGIHTVLIVTPGLVVQAKTVQNFTPGERKFIVGAQVPALVATPATLGVFVGEQAVKGAEPSRVYVFNIQQLIAPTEKDQIAKSGAGVTRRGIRKDNEVVGNVFSQLQNLDDLVIIADESHLYGDSAAAFNAALKELAPAAAIGLTASATKGDHVVFHYPLYEAIEDGCVKTPVLAFRKAGYSDEETQLRDALTLLGIKEQHYANYAQVNNVPAVRPILFVTCENTTHAAEIAKLLVSPSFLGSVEEVLRVDSTTTDDSTRSRLNNLDAAHSRVRVVVSVNMLKEGWDVKNIAVLCALRVSKSEVLTQQTMGRGLRLPYGKYTGVDHVDQLDIISHESYRAMLRDENVLAEFGLDGAMRSGQKPEPIEPTTGQQTGQNDTVDPSTTSDETDNTESTASGPYKGNTDTYAGSKPQVGVREVDQTINDASQQLHTVTDTVHDRYRNTTFLFPATRMEREAVGFSLSKITDDTLRTAASKVAGNYEVIERQKLTITTRKILRSTPVEQAEGEATPVSREDAAKALTAELTAHTNFPRTAPEIAIARSSTVPTFMAAVTTPWTTKSLSSAIPLLTAVLVAEIKKFDQARGTYTVVEPIELPVTRVVHYGLGDIKHDRIDSRQAFVVGRLYETWNRSLFPAVSFDSYSGEYALAELLDKSAAVAWWKRLVPGDKAKVAYTVRDNYYPDFVVYDSGDDVHWIVEAKAANKRDDEAVQAKKRATEELVKKLLGDQRFTGTRWGYFIAYEDDIAASDSWTELKQRCDLVGKPQ